MSFLVEIKVIFIFAILLGTALSGYFIIFFEKLKEKRRFLDFGNCFAAGIFILVGVVHLLHESQELFVEALDEELPIGYIVAIGGYSLILFIEHVLFSGHDHSLDEVSPVVNARSTDKITNQGRTPLNNEIQSDSQNIEFENVNIPATSPQKEKKVDTKQGVILTCALVVHSIIEGIAAGILTSESSLIILCVGILIHNIPAAFSLGIKLKDSTRFSKCFLMGSFALSSPVGIAIGIGLSHAEYPIIQAIFLSISAGTFIYIGCSEILPEQFHNKNDSGLKFAGFMAGFVPLAILSVLIHEDHEEH